MAAAARIRRAPVFGALLFCRRFADELIQFSGKLADPGKRISNTPLTKV
jgi:hypothetical protein